MKWLNTNIRNILFLIVTYLLILAFKGFKYASGDVVDVMSYARFIQDNSLFLNDFYVSNINSVIPNERFIYSSILALMGNSLNWMPFVLHFIFTIFFLIGLYKIISIYIKTDWLKWILVLILLGPLYKFNLGGNELYYNMFISSYIAKVFGVWSLLYFIKNKKLISYLLIVFSTLLHPTVGSQLFIIFITVELFSMIKNKSIRIPKNTFFGILVYLIIGGFYIYSLLDGVNKSGVDDKMFFEIFEFRNAHHFFPLYFGIKNYIVEISLFLIGILLMYRMKYAMLLQFSIAILAGLIIYCFGVLVLKSTFILSTQWFKSTIWLELLSLVMVGLYIENRFKIEKLISFNKYVLGSLLIIGTVTVIGIFSNIAYFNEKPYQFVYGMNLSQEEEIGLLAKKHTQKDDVFIYPLEFTGFKFYSERNIYIDYKSVVHRKDVLGDWYDRIKFIYGIDINTRRACEDLFIIAKQNYLNLDESQIVDLKNKGINYIVQYNEVKMAYPLVAKNEKYSIYKL